MRAALSLLLLIVVLSGCRTYGGYGSEDALAEEIARTATLLEAEANRLAGDRAALEAASHTNAAALLAEFDRIAAGYDQVTTRAQEAAGEFAGSGAYRALNRGLGAIVTDHQIVRDAYRRLLDRVAVESGMPQASGLTPAYRYQVEPVYYARIRASLERLSMRDATAS